MQIVRTCMTVVCAATLFAADGRARSPKEVVIFGGRCEKMVASGIDRTGLCESRLIHIEYTDKRDEFLFYSEGNILVVFSGDGGKIVIDADTQTQPIDKILMQVGKESKIYDASGICRFLASRKVNGAVSCAARTSEGEFLAEFRVEIVKSHIQGTQ